MDGDSSAKAWANYFKGAAVGAASNAKHYAIKLNTSRSTVVQIYDKTVKNIKGNPKTWIRVDKPHAGVDFPHINLNKAVTGVRDPHTPISGAQLQAAKQSGRVLKTLNDNAALLTAAAVAHDAYCFYNAYEQDCAANSTSNNMAVVGSRICGTWIGGYAGATAGAMIGTTIFPGVGTLLGSIIGGMGGAVTTGSYASQAAKDYCLLHKL